MLTKRCRSQSHPLRNGMSLILPLLAFAVGLAHAEEANAVASSAAAAVAAAATSQNGSLSMANGVATAAGMAGAPAAAAVDAASAVTTTATPIEPDVPEYLRHCFYAEAELCHNLQQPPANGQLPPTQQQQQHVSQPTQPSAEPSGEQAGNGGEPMNALTSAAATSPSSPAALMATTASPPPPPPPAAAANSWPALGGNRDVNKCQCRPHPTVANSWYCCNITNMSMISTCNNSSNWTNLHIRNISMPELDLSNAIYQTLHSLAITDGDVRNVTKSLSRVSSIKCLNISNNNLWNISMRALSSVPNLKYLDISKNNLSRIPKWNQNQNISVDVRDNKRMLCEPLLEAIFRDSFKFVEPDNSYCLLNYTYNWFNSTDYVSIRQVELTRRFQTECPVIEGYGNCTCSPEQMIVLGNGDRSQPTARLFGRVDCSNLGLIELPPHLPENTFSLNISNNNITSISTHFHSNPTYENIVKLYADNNQIASMNELEGTKFMYRFQRLSLRNNAMNKIPDYLLANVLDSVVGRLIYLGGNKLQCDCNSAKVLKLWLLERLRDIPDYNEILCRNMPLRVMELQEIKMCQSPHDWTDYIYYLIATEVLLLFALIAKVSYDYWVFKTAGYLPWPASKMPKLPCDWLCES